MRNKKLEKISKLSKVATLLDVMYWFTQVFRISRLHSDPCFFNLVKLETSPVGIYLLKLTNSNTLEQTVKYVQN